MQRVAGFLFLNDPWKHWWEVEGDREEPTAKKRVLSGQLPWVQVELHLGTKHEPQGYFPRGINFGWGASLGGIYFLVPVDCLHSRGQENPQQRDASVGSWKSGQNTLRKSRPRGTYMGGAPTMSVILALEFGNLKIVGSWSWVTKWGHLMTVRETSNFFSEGFWQRSPLVPCRKVPSLSLLQPKALSFLFPTLIDFTWE